LLCILLRVEIQELPTGSGSAFVVRPVMLLAQSQ
jgi:hypothetical protein